MLRQFFLVFVIFISCWGTGNAFNERFYNVNQLFGISLREVNSVCSDNRGFIWASSKFGIIRISGDDHKMYKLPYANTNIISVKIFFENGRLVAYSNNGQVFLFNSITDRFELLVDLSVELKRRHIYVLNVFVDSSGAFWIGTSIGMYRFESGQLSVPYEFRRDNFVLFDYDDKRFMMVHNEGFTLLDKHQQKITPLFALTAYSPLLPSSIYYDKIKNRLWIGTMSKGLYLFDFDSKSFRRVLEATFPTQPVLAIERNSPSTILVGVDGYGILELDSDGNTVNRVLREQVNDPNSVRGNGVYDIFCDENNRVWVATYSGGLSFFDQASPIVSQLSHQINNVNSLFNDDVNSIVEDKYGKLWFGTNNGISCWDKSTDKWVHLLNDQTGRPKVFLSLCEDNQGRIWAGSYSSGVYVFDSKNYKELAHYTSNEGDPTLMSNFILHVFTDSEGDVWMGGVYGACSCYLTKTGQFRTYSREPINVFQELSPGQILLGTSYGLLQLDKQTGAIKYLYLASAITDILLLDGKAWLATGGEGLVKYDPVSQAFEIIDDKTGLPSNFVKSLRYADGYIWIGTEGGMFRLDPKDNNVVTYESNYLLSRSSFNKTANCKLKNGQLVWGTNKGALFFHPSQLREMSSEGQIYFEDLQVSGRSVRDIDGFGLTQPVDSLASITLSHFQNTISLELLPIKTTAGAKLSWILENFDNGWSIPSDNNIVTYTNMPSGKFTLKIRLYDGSQSRVIAERVLDIVVVPPFWRSFWFLGGIYVIILGFALLVLQYIIKSIRQKHTEEKVRFFTNTAHDIRTLLTLIKAPVEELNKEQGLSEVGKYYLDVAVTQARKLSSVVTQLMDFQKVDVGKEHLSLSMVNMPKFVVNRLSMFKSLAASNNIEIEFNSSALDYYTAIDEAKMERVVDNLVSNAIKYSNTNGKVSVNFEGDGKHWRMKVVDNGIGMNKSVQRNLFQEFFRGENAINSKVGGTGIGLLLVKNYITLHNGSVNLKSQENIGTTFEVVVPYRKVVSMDGDAVAVDVPTNLGVNLVGADTADSEAEDITGTVSMRILIVEDNDDLLMFMRKALSSEFELITATDGIEAWELITKHMPDLVVSDVMMPNMDGFDLCRLMKSTYETSHIPIVLLTALSDKTEQLKGLGLGADDYLTKPFDIGLLVHRIKSIIRNRSVVREKTLKLIRINTSEPVVANEMNDKFMKKMVEVTKENIANSVFTKDDFAAALNVSPSLLYKKVKSLTNLSPSEFIKVVRLNYAQELLQSRTHSVTEVSEMCGFTSVGYFSTVFRKHFGISPSEV
jgi:signal transduction histidine kinase/CheY-like chemotaxis protein/ligand-binding sensor domain-containing protein